MKTSWLNLALYEHIVIDFIDGDRKYLDEDEELLINFENVIIRQTDNSLEIFPIYRVLRIDCKRR